MLERTEIRAETPMKSVLMMMAEGNIGALTVLMKVFQEDKGFLLLLQLDDMNIRGTQVWLGYKDYAKEDLPTFIEAIRTRSLDMVNVINAEGRRGNHPWLAVTSGASKTGSRRLL